jgi:hypothetical protein
VSREPPVCARKVDPWRAVCHGVLRDGPRAAALAVASVITAAASVSVGRVQQIYRSSVDLVLVDLRVLSGDEQVADLRADEVALLWTANQRDVAKSSFSLTS